MLPSLEIVVSHQALDQLPKSIVKIVLAKSGMTLEPQRRIYSYGIEAVLDIEKTKIKISPAEDTVHIGNDSFYIHSSGLVYITIANGEICSQHYVSINKFMEKYRQRQEKEYLREKTREQQKYSEDRKRDRY